MLTAELGRLARISFATIAVALTGLLVVVTRSSSVRAQSDASPNEAMRRDLLAQAEQARDAADHTRALDLAERAARLRTTPSLRWFIGIEQLALGQFIEAQDMAMLCVREAERDPSVRNRAAVVSGCQQLVADAQQHLARLSVQVPAPVVPGLRISVGGHVLDPNFYGVPSAVNAGHVTIEASAPGYVTYRASVDVAPRATADVRVNLRREGERGTEPAATPFAADTGSRVQEIRPEQGGGAMGMSTGTHRGGVPVGPVVLTGAGVVVMASAGVFWALRQAALAGCTQTTGGVLMCPAGAQTNVDAARTWNLLAEVALVGGGAMVAGGVVWFLLAPRRAGNGAPRAALRLAPLASGGWIGIGGTL